MIKDLNLIVKGDVQGSVEAVIGQLNKLEENKKEVEVRLDIKHSGVGNISETDVILRWRPAPLSSASMCAPDVAAQSAAERDGVDIRQLQHHLRPGRGHGTRHEGHADAHLRRGGARQGRSAAELPTPKGIMIAG